SFQLAQNHDFTKFHWQFFDRLHDFLSIRVFKQEHFRVGSRVFNIVLFLVENRADRCTAWRVSGWSDRTPSGKHVPPKRWATTDLTPYPSSTGRFGRGQNERAVCLHRVPRNSVL